MRRDRFERQFFGYARSSVNESMKICEQKLADAEQQVSELKIRLANAESQKEELAITVAAMRRQHIQSVSLSGAGESITVVVGPTDSIGRITGLIDALEGSPHLAVRFRVFRDGFYRVDGQAHDRDKLIGWLRAQSLVRDIAVDHELVHVSPRGVPA